MNTKIWFGTEGTPVPGAPSRVVRCGHCDTVVADGPKWMAQLTRFPNDMGGSLALLAGTMGTVPCPHCSYLVHTGAAHVVLFGGRTVVIGVPDDWPDEVGERAIAQFSVLVPPEAFHVARNHGAFRTALIRQGLEPAMALHRSFSRAAHPMTWMNEHVQQVDPEFLLSLRLMASGFIETYLRPAGGTDNMPVFVPKDEAPEDARHVVRNAEAASHLKAETGTLIGWLMTHLVFRCVETNSLEPLRDTLAAAVPESLLRDDEVVTALAAHVSGMVESFEPGTPGWIGFAYLHEAALALLCAAHGQDNPRRGEWTFWYLRYDVNRRLEKTDDVLLPTVEMLRSTLDPAAFWRHFQAQMRRVPKAAEGDVDQARALLGALMEAAERVFPDELTAQLEQHVQRAAVLLPKDVDAHPLLDAAVHVPLDPVKIRSCLAVLTERPGAPVARPLLDALERGSPDMTQDDRIAFLRYGIEFLKDRQRPDEATDLIEAGMKIAYDAGVVDGDDGDHVREATFGRFLNEVGNIMRLHRRLEAAVPMYEKALELIGGSDDDPDYRVALRNLGIVLRELHCYSEALEIFTSLRPKARPLEMRGLVTSEALCLLEMGQEEAATALMTRYMDHVDGAAVQDTGVLEFCTVFGALLAESGDLKRASETFQSIGPFAQQRQAHATLIFARDLELRRNDGSDAWRAVLEEQAAILGRIGPQPMGTLELRAIDRVVAGLVEVGETTRAEALLRGIADQIDPSLCPRGWRLHARAARFASQCGDMAGNAADIDVAIVFLEAGVATAVSSGDLQSFTAPDAAHLDRLVADALACRLGDDRSDERRWRRAADALAAPALTARLCASAALDDESDTQDEDDLEDPGPDPDADADQQDADDQAVAAWLRDGGSAALQICGAGGRLVLLRTTLESDGELRTSQWPLPVSTDAAQRLTRKLAFRLLRADPDGRTLPLQSLDDFEPVSAALMAATAGLAPDRPLLVVAGPLQESVVSLALGDRHPLCFAPSLRGAMALDARSRTEAPAARTLFGFATWFDREPAEPAAALAAVPATLERIGQARGLAVRHATGAGATRTALLEGLAGADVAWIACHGRLRQEAESVDLIVAADGRLPPARMSDAVDELRKAHVVEWQDLAALERAPATVFSSACSSGLAHVNAGGERIGLERAFLPAGTGQFVAPLWPVPTVAMQRVVAHLIETWLDDPATPLAVHLLHNRRWCLANGLPPLAGHALAVFGLSPATRT